MSPDALNELFSLLNALCEDRLTPEEKDRLEALVIENPQARRLYVKYMHLHGTLSWDAALSDSAVLVKYARLTGETPSVSRSAESPVDRTSWTTHRFGILSTLLSAVLVVAVYFALTPADPAVPVPAASAIAVDSDSTDQSPNLTQATPGGSGAEIESPIPQVDLHRGVAQAVDSPSLTSEASTETKTPPANQLDDGQIVARIDHLLSQKWDEAGVEPSPLAEDAEWLRRVYLDLAGHIPDAQTVDRFLKDSDPAKRDRIVQEIVQKPDYARNLTTIWMNLLVGRATERPINRELLSKFLREQFRQNRPWTETVTRLVAAEGNGEEVGEANFLLAHLNNQAVPATAVTARIFLCQQVQCTQCHKHPDAKHNGSMAEFWELNSFFQQAEVVENKKYNPTIGQAEVVSRSLIERPIGGPTYYDDLKGVMRVAYPKFAGKEVDPDPTVKRRQELARLLTHEGDRELAAALVNRTWAHFFGLGLVNPIDDMGPHSPCANPELLETLTDAVVASGFDVDRLNRWIVSTRAYHLSSMQASGNRMDLSDDGEQPLFSHMSIKPLSAEQLFDSLLVATAADRAGARYWEQAEQQRRAWLAQFYSVMENEENGDASTFDGTFSQSLMLMNGDLVRNAISNAPGTVLYEILRVAPDDQERIRSLCRAALGRDPHRNELAAFQPALRRRGEVAKNESDPFEDIFWVYLNSTEFTVNH